MQHDAVRGDVQRSVASARLWALFLILRWSRRTPLMEKPEVYWLANLWVGCLRVRRQDLSTPLRNFMRTQSQAGFTDPPYFPQLTSLWYLDSFQDSLQPKLLLRNQPLVRAFFCQKNTFWAPLSLLCPQRIIPYSKREWKHQAITTFK